MNQREIRNELAELLEAELKLNGVARAIAQEYRHWSTVCRDFYFDQEWQAEAFGMVMGRLEYIRVRREYLKRQGAA